MSPMLGIVKTCAPLAAYLLPTDLEDMGTPNDHRPPTIDMTLEGDVVAPPSFWTRALRIWRVLPRGTVPALFVAIIVLATMAVFLVDIMIVAVPVVIALALVTLLVRAGSGPVLPRPPTRR